MSLAESGVRPEVVEGNWAGKSWAVEGTSTVALSYGLTAQTEPRRGQDPNIDDEEIGSASIVVSGHLAVCLGYRSRFKDADIV